MNIEKLKIKNSGRKFKIRNLLIFITSLIILCLVFIFNNGYFRNINKANKAEIKKSYWFLLHRKSNVEYLYLGNPGNKDQSELMKKFTVKTGIPGERPTPLPKLAGRDYWLITKKADSSENSETAPYFISLDVPAPSEEPYGPVPYEECNDPASAESYGQAKQCNWSLPGEFGLHGVNGDENRLSKENPGSSGCVRHRDSDITYLYNLLNPEKEEIRYYVEDI